MLSKFIAKNYSFTFFVYCCLSKEYPEARWNRFDTITAPVQPEILASYALFIKRKFPKTVAECPFVIENA